MYCAHDDSVATEWHRLHYATRAVGGVGLIVVEATAVLPEGRISGRDLGLWNDRQAAALAGVASAVHENGGKIGVQLGHAGRKSEVEGAAIKAPSAIPYDEGSRVPSEMSLTEIQEIARAFQEAAKRADRAGFDLVEIHAAHGYLLNQFLSPLTNKRSDAYGGPLENRLRLLVEVLEAVSQAWPARKPICVRVSAEEYVEGGNSPDDLVRALKLLKDRGNGIDLVDVSTGGLTPLAPKTFPGYQLPHAERVRRETGLPVIGGGLITSAAEAEAAVASGQADLIFLGRELLRNPYWVLLAANKAGDPFPWPESYHRARVKPA
jgi:NADPH2 dehydrogenase